MSDNNDKKGRSLSPVIIASGIGAIIGGVATFASNVDVISNKGIEQCINFGLCSSGSHYMNFSISTLSPESGEVGNIFQVEGDEPMYILAPYNLSLEYVENRASHAIDLQNGVTGFGSVASMPYQLADNPAYWAPEEVYSGWKLGFPILDLIAAEKGKPVDITGVKIDVLSSEVDNVAYTQLVAPLLEFGGVLLVNESVHEKIIVDLSFDIVSESEKYSSCRDVKFNEGPAEEIRNREFSHSIKNIGVINTEVVSLESFLKKAVKEFDYYKYRNDLAHVYGGYSFASVKREHGDIPEPPNGYLKWELDNPYDFDGALSLLATRSIYGVIRSSSADGMGTFESFFCADIPLDPPEGLGGGGILFDDSKRVSLEFSEKPYQIDYNVKYRMDEHEPHFRTALMFTSESSGYFRIRIQIISFDRVLYTSDEIKLRTFVPKTTWGIVRRQRTR